MIRTAVNKISTNITMVSVFLPKLNNTQVAFCCAVLYCHQWPVQLYHTFSTLPYKWHDFRGRNFVEHTVRGFFFPSLYKFCLNISEIQIYKGLHVKTLTKLEFSQYIFEK
jgi:hypothetical protein